MTEQFFRDRSGYLWELVEGGRFEEGAYVKCADGPPGTYCDGVQRLMHWDPDGPVQIGVANERPSREFYVRQQADAAAARTAAEAERAAAQAEVDRIDALEAAATTIAAVKALNAPEGAPDPATGEPDGTPYEKRERARRAVADLDRRIAQHRDAETAAGARVAALDSLGRDMVPIPEVEAEVVRRSAAR